LPTALVTGITGQDGVYLTRLLLGHGYRVVGLVQPGSSSPGALASQLGPVELVAGDLRDVDSLATAVEAANPDEVYNLAGVSSVAQSWQHPELTAEVNALGVLRLVRALLDYGERTGQTPKLLQASSGEMFGSPEFSPQDETTPLRPRNPYAVSKAFAHEIVSTYRSGHGMFASTVILYNHESPLRPATFVTRKITGTVAAISRGAADRLVLGSLDVRRDWGHAADYVRAMWLALQHDVPGDYIVATGTDHSVGEFVAEAFAVVDIKDWERFVVSDPALVRPTDAAALVGNPARAREVLGWEPAIGFEELVREMVQHDLEALSSTETQRAR
jgi:GDPmannose 4,6-dehydratase